MYSQGFITSMHYDGENEKNETVKVTYNKAIP